MAERLPVRLRWRARRELNRRDYVQRFSVEIRLMNTDDMDDGAFHRQMTGQSCGLLFRDRRKVRGLMRELTQALVTAKARTLGAIEKEEASRRG
jgi:hypothetical protein